MYKDIYWLKWKLFNEKKSPIKLRQVWFCKPAIKWLESTIKRHWEILEFGGGGSTLFFSDNCYKVDTIETDLNWIKIIKKELKNKNVNFINIHQINKKYDLILIDDNINRYKHYEIAKKFIKKDGYIIFDNIDRYPKVINEFIIFKGYAIAYAGITYTGVKRGV